VLLEVVGAGVERDVWSVAMTYYAAKTKMMMRWGADKVSSDRGELIEKVKSEKGKETKERKRRRARAQLLISRPATRNLYSNSWVWL
jgi:hypothetical protein